MKNKPSGPGWLAANWPAPAHIHAGCTLRSGGVSKPPYDQLNLGTHVNDEQGCVLTNRERLAKELNLPNEPAWLNQVHGNNIIRLGSTNNSEITISTADGSYSTETDKVCVVMTADCLPLLLCDDEGQQIAAVHVGWRGFSKNIISIALEKFTCPNKNILAWLGPCISADHYEIDTTVYDAARKVFAGAEECFNETCTEHWLMDLKQLVSRQLTTLQIGHISTNPCCTYSEQTRFFSHRRNGVTGRMASLIWIDSQSSMD